MAEISSHTSEFARLTSIAADAFGRYQAGLSLQDAIEHACSGYVLDRLTRDRIESIVLASICRAASDDAGALDLAGPSLEYTRDRGDLILPVLDRARAGTLHAGEAAILSAAAHHDHLWELLDRISGGGERLSIGPVDPKAPELADQQSRLARQIARAPLDDRLTALVRARSGDFGSMEVVALAAATICVEIRLALAQVRMVVTLSRFGGS